MGKVNVRALSKQMVSPASFSRNRRVRFRLYLGIVMFVSGVGIIAAGLILRGI
ncbi:hypothetical protein [Phosphitispora sp. TUW77]|uniref:hypothetical protein n=1 Tax=Phosphitispora sp. TUW77 TaxID=3152361 RepID=UPI003AB881B0